VASIANDIENGRSISSYLSAAVQYMHPFIDKLSAYDGKPVVIGPDKGLGFLVSYQLNSIYSVRLTSMLLEDVEFSDKKILGVIRNLQKVLIEYSPQVGKCFSAQKVHALLRKVKANDSLNIISPPESRLIVICIPYQHKKYNSQYIGSMNIILTSVARDEETVGHPDYIFLHELGHAYHGHITQGQFDIPASFIPVLEFGFQTDFLNTDNSLDVFREIFADCFSVAISDNDKRLSSINPFCPVFDPRYKQLLKFYFHEISSFPDMKKAITYEVFWTKKRKAFVKNIYDMER
jgi:hypothetical protein